jgi:putative two-component system hydrogenase maturation factor HypX/HoxX
MKLLLFSSAYNGLTQRVDRELMHAGHEVSIELGRDVAVMERAVADCNPELII